MVVLLPLICVVLETNADGCGSRSEVKRIFFESDSIYLITALSKCRHCTRILDLCFAVSQFDKI